MGRAVQKPYRPVRHQEREDRHRAEHQDDQHPFVENALDVIHLHHQHREREHVDRDERGFRLPAEKGRDTAGVTPAEVPQGCPADEYLDQVVDQSRHGRQVAPIARCRRADDLAIVGLPDDRQGQQAEQHRHMRVNEGEHFDQRYAEIEVQMNPFEDREYPGEKSFDNRKIDRENSQKTKQRKGIDAQQQRVPEAVHNGPSDLLHRISAQRRGLADRQTRDVERHDQSDREEQDIHAEFRHRAHSRESTQDMATGERTIRRSRHPIDLAEPHPETRNTVSGAFYNAD